MSFGWGYVDDERCAAGELPRFADGVPVAEDTDVYDPRPLAVSGIWAGSDRLLGGVVWLSASRLILKPYNLPRDRYYAAQGIISVSQQAYKNRQAQKEAEAIAAGRPFVGQVRFDWVRRIDRSKVGRRTFWISVYFDEAVTSPGQARDRLIRFEGAPGDDLGRTFEFLCGSVAAKRLSFEGLSDDDRAVLSNPVPTVSGPTKKPDKTQTRLFPAARTPTPDAMAGVPWP